MPKRKPIQFGLEDRATQGGRPNNWGHQQVHAGPSSTVNVEGVLTPYSTFEYTPPKLTLRRRARKVVVILAGLGQQVLHEILGGGGLGAGRH